MNKSNEVAELAKALNKAQGEIEYASKDAKNPFFKSHYATLNAVWEACRDSLKKNGLSVTQTGRVTDKGMVLVTTLFHTSGQWVEGEYLINPVKTDPQSVGSAWSYAKRYSLSALLGIVAEVDDDGNAASTEVGKAEPALLTQGPIETGQDTFVPKDVKEEPFKSKAGKACTRYVILSPNGARYTSMLKQTYTDAYRAKREGKEISVAFKRTDFGYDVVGLLVKDLVDTESVSF